jgi:integrase
MKISLIKAEQLSGLNSDSITENLKGHITIQSKGGKENVLKISPETYAKLEHHIRQNGEFKIDKDSYMADLQNASVNTNQQYNGSHGLRWSFAQERFQEIQQHGYTYEQALTQISHELGHERADITEHYLR